MFSGLDGGKHRAGEWLLDKLHPGPDGWNICAARWWHDLFSQWMSCHTLRRNDLQDSFV